MAAEKRRRSSSPTARHSRSPSSPTRPSFRRSPVRTTSESPDSKQQKSGTRRSSKNLSIDICKDFTKRRCNRVDCKYAHPPPVVAVEQNKVIVCFDSLHDRCLRGISCRYYHPSSQIRVSLQEAAGIQPSAVRLGYQVDIRPSNLFFVPPGLPHPLSVLTSSSSSKTSTKLAIEVCRDYVRGHCARDLDECRYAHHSPTPGQGDYVLVCNDHLRGKCERDACRYFHAPEHLRSRIRHVTVGSAATINSIHCNSSGDAAYAFWLLSYQQYVKRIRTRDNAGDHLSRVLGYHVRKQYGAPNFQVPAIHGPPLVQAPLLRSPDVAGS